MASQVGQKLREARIERGIELSEVERVTYIRIKFLRAMEEDRWEVLPAPAYARGFLSTYARFLGLDDQALLDEYRRTSEGADRAEPVPPTVLQPGASARRRSIKPVAMVLTVLVAAAVLGLVIVGSLGGSDDGGNEADRRGRTAAGSAATNTTTGEIPGAQASVVSLELRSTGTVWVCLLDDQDRAPVNGETLTANEVRGPFDSRAFEVTLGNGFVEMTVDGEPTEIPPAAEPLGYRITASGVRELDPSSQPTCQ
jgi:cytoskeleton protein RodZ